ncbi:MAG: hypothetical protein H0T46_36730 [Deltaproteobacteria bacterium]|nr:hypothetical protein [Deltaproteobacteria bacterium]
MTRFTVLVGLVALCAGCDSNSGPSCGSGTHLLGEACVADEPATPVDAAPDASAPATERFEIRISETLIDANGHTKREVFVYGVRADGSTATDDVVLGLDRASAGTYLRTTLTLGTLGARTHFIPCSDTAADCLGTATLTLARASAPQVILATRSIQLVQAKHISTAAPCRTGGNILYVDGEGAAYNARVTITQASWQTEAITMNGQLKEIVLRATPLRFIDGRDWSLRIDTYALSTALGNGYYLDAERSHFATTGHPGLDVSGGRGCTAVGSSFEVHDLVVSGDQVTSATVTFEQHCSGVTGVMEGCFHYGP